MSDAIRAFTWDTLKDKWTQGVCAVLVIVLSIYNVVFRINWSAGIMEGGWNFIAGVGVVVPFSLIASVLLVWIGRITVAIFRGIWLMTQQWLEDKMGVTALREKYEQSKSDKAAILAARQRDLG